VADWLRARGTGIAGLVVHPESRSSHREELIRSAGVEPDQVLDGSQLGRPEVVARLRELRPDIGLSVLFGYMLKPEVLDLLPAGCLNLHPSLLPYNRGAYPNVWAIIERTPAGATLHYMDAGLDTGAIVAQKEIPVEPVDTGETLYHRQADAALALLQETWPSVEQRRVVARPQPAGEGTSHRRVDVQAIDEIVLEHSYRARDLIDLLRARTFPPHPGAYFKVDGRRVEIRVALRYLDEAAT
jgi:methionyl-tRNA formyltransferase